MSKIEVNEIDAQTGNTITVGSACKSVAVPGNVVKTNAVQASDGGNIVSQCGTTNTIGAGGDTTNVPGAAVVTGNVTGANLISSGNVVKSNAYQASDGGNIVSQSGTAITLGASGDTISLASGASQTGFGRTGTVDWQTSSIKTTDFTASNGEGYFINTTSGSITATLPSSPSAGDIVALADYANTADSNNIIVANNGSKIMGILNNFIISVEGSSVTFVFIDSTQGWRPTDASKATDVTEQASYISATGGSIATCGDFKIHTFTGPGTFCVSAGSGSIAVADYRVVAGGGAGGAVSGGGGAGGGHRTNYPSGCSGIPISAGAYPITVGAGGTAQSNNFGNSGSNSIFSIITSAGGGGGGGGGDGPGPGDNTGRSGGSGGGGGGSGPDGSGANPGGSGNTPSVSPPQGNNGGPSSPSPASGIRHGGGGGGSGATGGTSPTPNRGGFGGNGTANSITNSSVTYAGGGGGGSRNPSFGSSGPSAPGGSGGGGKGGGGPDGGANGAAGGTNQGGGGGGGQYTNGSSDTGSNGGSGIVIIRYRFQA